MRQMILAPLRWLVAPLEGRALRHGQAYRPEIDGLRAVAVLAVVLHHLNPQLLPGGFLGVDIFFVISGYVVTASLLARKDKDGWTFIQGFYGRRFRRLQPALLAMVLLTSGLFVLVASPLEDGYLPSLRTGVMALFGLGNVYLMRQSSHYFSVDNFYQPFVHTWSLGVEEQYYLIWPVLVMLCGLGRQGVDRRRLLRLAILTLVLFTASLTFYCFLHASGQQERAFFLLPARFWELALGCLAALLHGQQARPPSWAAHLRSPSWGGPLLMAALLGLLTVPEAYRLASTMATALATAALLLVASLGEPLGRWLGHRSLVLVGLLSYSIYLWHWPLIVLARWTFGLQGIVVLPLLLLMGVAALLSYRLELRFRYGPTAARPADRSLLTYPLLSAMAAALLLLLQGPLKARLYLGSRDVDPTQTSNNKQVEGTTINTANCFLDPTAPVPGSASPERCSAVLEQGRPSLYFEGDSHTHALIPIGAGLLREGGFNISFLARGGCPFPYFEPWYQNAHLAKRYGLCKDHYQSRLADLSRRLKSGDRLVVVASLPNYFGTPTWQGAEAISDGYRRSLLSLADAVAARGARLVLFLPMPSFQKTRITGPLSLCHREWFRPAWALGPDCAAVTESRQHEWTKTDPIRALQEQLARDSKVIDVFDPFAVICPASNSICSNYHNGQLLFQDGSHLTAAGARSLGPSLQAFLQGRTWGSAQGSAPGSLSGTPSSVTVRPAPGGP